MQPIIVVDDSLTFGKLLVRLAERATGRPCVLARSLAACREALQTAKEPFAAALLDLNLPDAPNGEVVDLVLASGIPSVVFTGEFSDDLREEMWQKRIVDYVFKEGPHALSYVSRLLARLLRNRGMKALVVDDSRVARDATSGLLAAHGFHVFQASGGEQALDVLAANPDMRLLITDSVMPGMDGPALVKAVRERYGMDRLAVIGVSAQGSGPASVALLKSGANDFITKPFNAEEFYCRVNQNVDMLNLLEDMRDLADRDFLTGLANRRFLFEAGATLLAGARRAGRPLTAAILDLDHFKQVNDTFGHEAGDAVLKHFASLLRQRFRESDLIARLGGEEFCLLLADMDPASAKEQLDAFRAEVASRPAVWEGREIACTVSVGVYSGPAASLEGCIKAADDLLYRAKQNGRNLVEAG